MFKDLQVPFLSARWEDLIVVNYEIDPVILLPFVPKGTELDFHEGKTYVSLVAFNFFGNKFLGMIPTFPVIDFQEINLRFYIKRTVGDETRRAVAFIREVVPSRIIAGIARRFYNEPYDCFKTKFMDSLTADQRRKITYQWNDQTQIYSISAELEPRESNLESGSLPHFILEHYWGYNTQRDGRTCEYQVQHVPWQYWDVASVDVSRNIRGFYGHDFEAVLSHQHHSVFVAKGSPVTVSFPLKFRIW